MAHLQFIYLWVYISDNITRVPPQKRKAPEVLSRYFTNLALGKRNFLIPASIRKRMARFSFPLDLLENSALLETRSDSTMHSTLGRLPRKRDHRRSPRCSGKRIIARRGEDMDSKLSESAVETQGV